MGCPEFNSKTDTRAQSERICVFIIWIRRQETDCAIAFSSESVLEIWRDLRFNVFFKGDDWQGTEKGVSLERQFAEVGVEVVYLPYSQATSSTDCVVPCRTLMRWRSVRPVRQNGDLLLLPNMKSGRF
jgi:hypothetical protein